MDTPEKSRILFVDDDPNLLDGLKRTLRPHRHVWEMTFVNSAREALSSLEKMPVDVILTDFRMGGMSGLDLLREVKRCYPQVIRILFSGEVDQALIMQSVRVAHQFISKPCSAGMLKDRIDQTISLREILEDDALRVIVSRIDALPSLPALYGEILSELKSPTASIKKIGQIIAGDIAMASKILQLVNSAFSDYVSASRVLSRRFYCWGSISSNPSFFLFSCLPGLIFRKPFFGHQTAMAA